MNNIVQAEVPTVLQAQPDELSKANSEVLEAIQVSQDCCEELDHLEKNLIKLKNSEAARKAKCTRVRRLFEEINL